ARRGHRRAARAALGAHGGEVGGRPARRVPLAHLHPAGCRTDTRPGPGRCVAGPGLRSRRARAGRRVLLRPPRGRRAFQGGVAMLLAIAGFEARQGLRRVSTYVYFLVFLILAAFFILAAGGAIPGANVDFGTGGKVAINSPWSLASLMTLIASFTVVITASIAGRATHQDVDSNFTPLLFTRPITRAQYLAGRFLGALAVLGFLSIAIGFGAWLASVSPWMPASRVAPQRFAAYAIPYFLVLFPDLLLMASVFFALAVLTRR